MTGDELIEFVQELYMMAYGDADFSSAYEEQYKEVKKMAETWDQLRTSAMVQIEFGVPLGFVFDEVALFNSDVKIASAEVEPEVVQPGMIVHLIVSDWVEP